MSQNISKIIDKTILDFYMNSDKEEIENSLKEDIQDYQAYTQKRDALERKLKFMAKGIVNQQKDDALLKIAEQYIQAINAGIERPIAFLKQLMKGKGQFALNSNLDKLSKDEIINLIRDKNLVELLEQLEGRKND